MAELSACRENELRDAAAALIRAADAINRGKIYPHCKTLPCPAQMAAAEAEVQCAEALIDRARTRR